MATSITQAKPLLTAAELELFDNSRADPIKQFSVKQLAGKEKRCRTLRDKYRDLYRRQTVALRGKAKGGAQSAQDANARTQRKAEIMQEMLERFEARSSLLIAREAREQPAAAAPVRARPAPGKRLVKPAAKAAEKVPAKATKVSAKPTKVSAKPVRKSAARGSSAATPAKPSASKAPATGKVRAAPAKKGAAAGGAKSPFPTSANPPKARKPKAPEQALSAVANLQQASDDAPHIDHLNGTDPTPRSNKAPSKRAPTYGGKARAPDVNAPLDMVASAQRGNPVRAMPGNIAIQGHVSSNVRRVQGKRDSR